MSGGKTRTFLAGEIRNNKDEEEIWRTEQADWHRQGSGEDGKETFWGS